MSTAVFFHAHPDDEVLFTGGTMARAAAEGHRVVLVTATRGDRGLDRAGLLVAGSGETVAERRTRELQAAASRLGVARCEILGYEDSGADGAAATGFVQAEAEEAAARLAKIVADEAADVLVIYDERGIYGHPDHVQVHKVGLRAAQLANTPSVFMATIDRDRLESLLALAETFGLAIDDATLDWAVNAGVAAERITTTIDVSEYVEAKRDAMAAHQTQFPPSSGLLQLPKPAFELVFGTEWYIELGGTARRTWLW
ncbi:MAG TPA: PIG-L family deacetylase [Acidimicrobiales bacterium]|nr:PIG-L family deacetylase [Acidimicrobiales bacterium]